MRPHCFRRVTSLSIVAVLAASAAAQSLQWQPLPALGAPGFRTGFGLVPFGDELLLFGGDAANPGASEYAWDGIAWRPVTTPVPRRDGAAIAAGGGEILVFGGLDGLGATLTDTWRLSGGVWTQQPTPTAPVLVDPSMTYDPIAGTFVLAGGATLGGMQTYRFVGGDWQLVVGQALPQGFARLCADTVRGEVLATDDFGGPAQLFRLQGDDWVSLGSLGVATTWLPTFDDERGRAVLLAPTSANALETREWDGDTLSVVSTTSAVGAQNRQAIAFHAARHEAVAAFAVGSAVELRRYAPAAVPMTTAYGDPCQDATFSLSLGAGDSPQPGVPHRLEVHGQPAAPALVLCDIGLSHVATGGVPLPIPIPLGSLGCLLRIDPLVVSFLGISLPAVQLLQFANDPALLGVRYDAQAFLLDATGVVDASNGLEVQLGLPLAEHQLVESFVSGANRDALASGDSWSGGATVSAQVGGDGRHGSFVASDGAALGGSTFEWSTDNQLIPAERTLDGQSQLVTDGHFWFSDFVVPAGVTVRFVGSVPAVVHVRGEVRIDGRVESNGADAPGQIATIGPATGQRVSNFYARGIPNTIQALGQPGTAGGCGGGRGGEGGKEGNNLGPEVQNGVSLNDGQRGDDVRLAAGHAYAAQAGGTGGQGGTQTPATGISPFLSATQLISSIYLPFYCSGGSGGGYSTGGGNAVPCDPLSTVPLITEPDAQGGAAFPVSPYPNPAPSGYSSLQHFAIGGSGGGGGGSHGFGMFGFPTSTERWMAGSGGMGGGGAIALRAGGSVTIGAAAQLQARGGNGVIINGDDQLTAVADNSAGISSPGGGGSGGSFLIQSGADIGVHGSIDTSGGAGSTVDLVGLAVLSIQTPGEAGAGSAGFFRLESLTGVAFTGTSVPTYDPVTQSDVLLDRDDRTGSRSKWLLPPSAGLPVYVRYELLVDVDGNGFADAVFSDDPAVGALASGPAVPVQLRLQGARLDPATGQPLAGTVGPWRTTAAPGGASINRDHARLVRFDLVCDRGQFPDAKVTELRIVWR
ncbi:MAG: hypothetical protein H6835_00540 [Planctomycetes bacterium]|nr:hypothetical protein [Planctomycetota bacterium]